MNPIRFIRAQRFSVNQITLPVSNCHFIHQSKSGARFSAWLISHGNVPHADKTKTPLNSSLKRPGKGLETIDKRGRKAKEDNQNKNCRFCGTNFETAGRRASFQNIFSPTLREESPGLILAECCGTMGLSVTKNPNLSKRVCLSCSRKIKNAAEPYRFFEEAISAREDVNCENRKKRLLPTAITPERIKGKKQVIEIVGDEREITPGKIPLPSPQSPSSPPSFSFPFPDYAGHAG